MGAYDPQPGKTVVAEARAALGTCTTWTTSENLRMTVLSEVQIDEPRGVDDVFAYCHEMTFLSGPVANTTVVVCEAMLSRGHLVAMVGTSADTPAAAEKQVRLLVPGAAAGLRRALPDS